MIKYESDYELELGTEGSAGFDLIVRRVDCGDTYLRLWFGVKLDFTNTRLVGLIQPRSSTFRKYGLLGVQTPGIIDSDYTGELVYDMYSQSGEFRVDIVGKKLAQIVFVPCVTSGLKRVSGITPSTTRGDNMNGSTGN